MALDFGLLGTEQKIQTADYRSAGSHQAENIHYELVTDAAQWEEIHTVTTGKTFYCSAIIISTEVAGFIPAAIGTGAAASEVVIIKVNIKEDVTFSMALPTPIKFSSGTRIAAWANTDTDTHFTLIGWEE